MAFSKHSPLVLSLALLAACGPGTNTSDAGTDTTDSGPGTTQAASTGDTPTTDTPTTANNTSDPTLATSSATSSATSEATTADATTGEPVCPDVFPEDGAPCDAEGLTCGGPCEDPCSFCNVIRCEGGKWAQLEVFPADCPDCETVCALVVPLACMAGPPDMDTCVTGCQTTQAGNCGLVYNIMLACIGGAPSFICDADGHPNVAGCETQFADLYACLG
ncbi:hypothetical protein [Nannocystis sp.]|uniref:hypothetical protein n=1 Tax=Nannocystis sp. TaxID=1962667 RepID=UPI0024277B3D|nr:hypothetical protein [Nannocystis sp.]MBK7827603.1 hypothetical protein [Nannocystis sp.]MBK9756489.1 hypothetical protein [Nannocystis sp.]